MIWCLPTEIFHQSNCSIESVSRSQKITWIWPSALVKTNTQNTYFFIKNHLCFSCFIATLTTSTLSRHSFSVLSEVLQETLLRVCVQAAGDQTAESSLTNLNWLLASEASFTCICMKSNVVSGWNWLKGNMTSFIVQAHSRALDNAHVHTHRHTSTQMLGAALKPAVPLCLNYYLSAQI